MSVLTGVIPVHFDLPESVQFRVSLSWSLPCLGNALQANLKVLRKLLGDRRQKGKPEFPTLSIRN